MKVMNIILDDDIHAALKEVANINKRAARGEAAVIIEAAVRPYVRRSASAGVQHTMDVPKGEEVDL